MNQMCRENTLIYKAKTGDQLALEELFAAYQPLVVSIAKRLCWNQKLHDELVQAGNLGLLKAVQRFDLQRRIKLATYAVPWILGEIRSVLRQFSVDMISLDEARGEEKATLLERIAGDSEMNLTYLDLHLALQKLCREEQMLICLRYFRDKTQIETAMLLHKSQAQISKMESRALETLRTSLC